MAANCDFVKIEIKDQARLLCRKLVEVPNTGDVGNFIAHILEEEEDVGLDVVIAQIEGASQDDGPRTSLSTSNMIGVIRQFALTRLYLQVQVKSGSPSHRPSDNTTIDVSTNGLQLLMTMARSYTSFPARKYVCFTSTVCVETDCDTDSMWGLGNARK